MAGAGVPAVLVGGWVKRKAGAHWLALAWPGRVTPSGCLAGGVCARWEAVTEVSAGCSYLPDSGAGMLGVAVVTSALQELHQRPGGQGAGLRVEREGERACGETLGLKGFSSHHPRQPTLKTNSRNCATANDVLVLNLQEKTETA